jgi:hypothetical protein
VVYGGFENKQIVGYQNVDELMELIKPYVYVKEKRACLNLPPRLPVNSPPGIIRHVQMAPHQRKLYDEARKKTGNPRWEGEDVAISMSLEKFLRMQQIIQGIVSTDTGQKDKHGKRILRQHRLFDDPLKNPKLAETLNLVEEISGQIVIYSPFVFNVEDMTAILKKVYPKERVLTLPKAQPQLLRQMCKDFYKGDYRFCVSSQRQGGIGINGLQSAGDTIYIANTQNLENRIQSEGRTERQGSTATSITFWDIIMDDSEDDKSIVPSLREKCDLADFVRRKLKEGCSEEDLY